MWKIIYKLPMNIVVKVSHSGPSLHGQTGQSCYRKHQTFWPFKLASSDHFDRYHRPDHVNGKCPTNTASPKIRTG